MSGHYRSEYPPRIVCYVCGLEGPADYPLYVSPHGYTGLKSQPYFPFLKELEPPLGCRLPDQNSAVFSCRQCYSALMKQWDDNDQGGVPTEKRVYWTKRCAGLSILDPEQQLAVNKRETAKYPAVTMSSCPPISRSRPPAMGPPQSTDPMSQDDTDSALDLSSGSRGRETMKSCSSAMSHISAVSHHSSYMSEGAGSSTDILDLTLPDKNATTEVCYVCGDEFKKGALNYIHTRPVSRNPHYPSLVHHPRPPRSRPMDSAGRVQACEECNGHLQIQYDKFEEEKLAHVDRNYILRKRQTPIVDTTTFVCYICALDYHSSSLRLLYCRNNSENEPYYPQVEQTRPPPGASSVTSGGMVQVCSHCYKCTRDKYTGYVSSSGPEPPPKKRKSSRAASCSVPEIITDVDTAEEDGKLSPADVECPLCRRKYTVHSFKFLHSLGPPLGGLPYFPFLRTLPRLNDEIGLLCEDDSQGRVRACQACHNSLINQWTAYQREQAPIDERTYSYQSLVGQMSSGRLTPGDTRVSARATATPTSGRSLHSPGAVGGSSVASGNGNNTPSKYQSESVRPRSNSNTVVNHDNSHLSPARTLSNNLETARPRSNSNPHSPRIPTGTGSGQPPTCHSPISVHSATSADPAHHKPNPSSFYCFLCGLHSELSFARMLYSEAQGKKAPFFPFMKDHSPKPRAEVLRDDGTALVCTFCYHSVMEQWQRYQDERNPISPTLRKYNINDYVCFVCHVRTYRKRIRALRVMDFPFFRQHKQTKGTITMENGDMAAVCLDCFENLKNQFVEAAKYGIPVEKRQYNWMQVPPPPEDSVQLITPKERLDKHISVIPPAHAETGLKIHNTSNNQQQKDSPDYGRAGGPTSSGQTKPGPSGQAGPLQIPAPAPVLTISAPSVPPVSTRPGFAAALRDLARTSTVTDPAMMTSKHMTTVTSFTRVPVVATSGLTHLGLAAGQPSLPAPVAVPPLLPSYPVHPVSAGILPPSLPTSVPSLLHPYGLETDPLYRAHLERYVAASMTPTRGPSPYITNSSAGVVPAFNPSLLGQLMPLAPQPPSLRTHPPPSTMTSRVNKHQSGNANGPSPSPVPSWEGPVMIHARVTSSVTIFWDTSMSPSSVEIILSSFLILKCFLQFSHPHFTIF